MSALDTTTVAPAAAPKQPGAPSGFTWQCSDYFGCGQKITTSSVVVICPSCGGRNFEHVPGG
jgi:hypothetical protein